METRACFPATASRCRLPWVAAPPQTHPPSSNLHGDGPRLSRGRPHRPVRDDRGRGRRSHRRRSVIFPHLSITPQDTPAPQSTKSWRSGNFHHPGWRGHTGGSRSIPTVHPCSQSGGGCGLLAKHYTLHEPNHEGNGRSIHNNFEKEFWKVGFLKEFFF